MSKEKESKIEIETPETEEEKETEETVAETEGDPEAEETSEESGDPSAQPNDEEEAGGEEVSEEEKEKAKAFFKKKKTKAKAKDKSKEIIEELNDKVKRQMAEFENFRKRSEKEKSAMYDMGASSMIEKILPVVDSFERGLAGIDEESEDPFEDGMRMVYKQLMKALEEAGVEVIEAVGKEFDPDVHNAVMHIDDEEYGENEIVEELQKGYKYHDHVVRHSMVKVAN